MAKRQGSDKPTPIPPKPGTGKGGLAKKAGVPRVSNTEQPPRRPPSDSGGGNKR